MTISTDMLDRWLQEYEAELRALAPSQIAALTAPQPRTGHSDAVSRGIAAARTRAQLARIAMGEAVWNNWAAAVNAQLAELGRDGRRVAEIAAFVDFSGVGFDYGVDLTRFAFPAGLSFAGARIGREAYLGGIQVAGQLSLEECTFGQDVWLDQAQLDGGIDAPGARFAGRIEARETVYGAPARWAGANFAKDVWFSGSSFRAGAEFGKAMFASEAGFTKAHFGAAARFAGAVFADNVGMEQCRFDGPLDFADVEFRRGAFFQNAVFSSEPRIGGASFDKAPRLDGARFLSDDRSASPAQSSEPALRAVAAR